MRRKTEILSVGCEIVQWDCIQPRWQLGGQIHREYNLM